MNFLRRFLCLLLLSLLLLPEPVCADDKREKDVGRYLDMILEELDFGEIEGILPPDLPEKMTFGSLVNSMIAEGRFDFALIREYVLDLFFYEIDEAKPMFIQIVCTSLLFAVFSKMIVSGRDYVDDLGFFLVYAAIMMLLMKSFLLVSSIVEQGLSGMISFMSAFIPTYATTLLLSGNANSAGFFYEVAFAMIFLLELMIRHVFLPGIHIYVLLQILDHLFEEARLSRFADLLESGIKTALKLSVAAVVGLGVVQSLVAPAKDRLSTNSVFQTISALPGLGNTFGATGEILLGCGILIKNSVGTAALILLIIISGTPAVSTACFHVMYRLTGALLQPFCDKRIGECVHGVGKACGLYLKIVVDILLLFFITISMISASTSFIY